MAATKTKRNFSLLPTAKDEIFSLDGKNCLELAFLLIVDTVRNKLRIEIDRNRDLLFDKFITDIIIIYFFLCIVGSILSIPVTFTQSENLIGGNYFIQIYVIMLFVSILWGGYVYITHQFRILINTKILPVLIQFSRTDSGYYKLLPQIFCGTYYEWKSGFGFRLFTRTLYISLFIVIIFIAIFLRVFIEIIMAIVFIHDIQALILLPILVLNFLIISLIIFVMGYALFTVVGIFIYLFLVVRDLPLDINPFIELGGTEKYGKLILNCLYYVSFAIGLLPVLLLISKFDIKNIHFAQDSLQTLGNVSSSLRSAFINSLKGVPLSTLSENFVFLELFVIFVFAAIAIIISLHYRIKQRKIEELHRLETAIKEMDVYNHEIPNITERNQYLLSLYEKVLNLNEWPIKRTFILELLVSVIPLLLSFLLI